MIEALLPSGVVAAEVFGDAPHAVLFPEEEAVMVRAVAKRRREFAAVRHCARTALATLGVPAVPLLPGERGAPRWPSGIVGSMTHCEGYAAAAVAPARQIRTLGVDAETHAPLPDGVRDLATLSPERAALARLAAAFPGVCWDRLLFSAKESVYKAWYPVARRFLGFEEAVVDIDASAGIFEARTLVADPPPGLARLTGRWLVCDGLGLTAVTVPAASP